MSYKPISDYGVIGDTYSAALVGIDGSIDWACFPRFDSPSIFAAILDDTKGGRFSINPVRGYKTNQSYLINTNILVTTFNTATGEVELLDFMPLSGRGRRGGAHHQIHRLVRCTTGTVELEYLFQPCFDYARANTRVSLRRHGVVAKSRKEVITLSADVPLAADNKMAQGCFSLKQGEAATFVLAYGRQRVCQVKKFRSTQALSTTRSHWEEVAKHIEHNGYWKDRVTRSFLLLHLLMYSPTGAIVAAPTTSLPEKIGGQRNWDYRDGWLRDSAFTMDILYRLGDQHEGQSFFRWLLYQCQVTNGDMRIVYGIDQCSDLRERTLGHLEGYKGSRPVRIGNGAAKHIQMDVFGEVILSIATYHKYGGHMSQEAWSIVEHFARMVCRNWHRADHGIWEIRSHPNHFVYSKVMCWVALDRSVALARTLGLGQAQEVTEWERTAKAIRKEVLTKGWSWSKKAFSQAYQSDHMDAANLILPLVGFLPGEDPRMLSTIGRIRKELAKGALVRRYHTNTGVDGLPGEEGAFLMLSFWLIGALLSAGEVQEASELFEEVLGYSNHLGLFPEMIDPDTKEALGNFPQAFSHIGLIHTARNLEAALATGAGRC